MSALALLLCERSRTALLRTDSVIAQRTILWDAVAVNRITKSGVPIWRLKSDRIFVNTFVLCLYFLQISLYRFVANEYRNRF